MKTICPHCKQEYPETPDEYLGMAFECPVCHKEFICEKPKFCSECGACNPAKALKCVQCGKTFLTLPSTAKGAAERPVPPARVDLSRTPGKGDTAAAVPKSMSPALKKTIKCAIFLIVLAGLAGGGYQAWKFVENKRREAKNAEEEKQQREKDAATLKKLKAAVAETGNYQLGHGLDRDEREADIRGGNAEKFLNEVNSILTSAGYPVLDEDFQYDFKYLTIYNHSDAYDTLELLKLRDKLSAAATVSEFCDAAKNADLPIETKEKMVAKFWYLAKEGDSAEQCGWKLREAMISVLRKRLEENRKTEAAGKNYLEEQIQKIRAQAFLSVRGQLSSSFFKSWDDVVRDGDDKDRSVLQNALKNERILCTEFGLNKMYSFSELDELLKATEKNYREMQVFIPGNKKFLRGVVMFPEKDEHPLFTTENGCLIDRKAKKLLYVIPSREGKYKIPSGIKSVADRAFVDCGNFIVITPTRVFRNRASWSNQDLEALKEGELVSSDKLKEIVIPAGTAEIESGIFENCYDLASVTIPPSVTAIGENAFRGCRSLKEIVLPSDLSSIGDGAFEETGLVSVTIPSGVTCIGNRTFRHCTNLKEIVLPSDLSSIGDGAFQYTDLVSVVIPDGVRSIGKNAFAYCRSLKEIVLPSDLSSIGDGAFQCTGLVSVTIPSGVTRIGDDTFRLCENLKEIALPPGIVSIGVDAFRASGLTSVVIPEGVRSIGKDAFFYSSSLKEVVLPSGIVSIGEGAFEKCPCNDTVRKCMAERRREKMSRNRKKSRSAPKRR